MLVSVLTHPVQTDELGEHFKKLNIVHPTPEGCDVRSESVDIQALGAEDGSVLALVGGNFHCPVNNHIQSLFVDCLAVVLVVRHAGIHDELVKLGIADVIVVGVSSSFANNVAAVVNLIHVRING